MIYFAQPSTPVTTWRTLWPAMELRRRGYEVQIDAMDAGFSPEEPPRGLAVVHVTPSLWAHEPWHRKLEAIRERAGTLVVSFDDDWTRMLEIPSEEGAW